MAVTPGPYSDNHVIPTSAPGPVPRLVALGDAHLGRQCYSRTTPDGVNKRERDFEDALVAAVDLALSLDPDAVLWLGTALAQPRPRYRHFRDHHPARTASRAATQH